MGAAGIGRELAVDIILADISLDALFISITRKLP